MISIKQQLIGKLRDAAEVEQQFMCMYLYGAYSIKKRYIDHQFGSKQQPQLEMSRRWLSTIYTVARQEMEHLALVNNLLRSIGAAPCFARENLPFSSPSSKSVSQRFLRTLGAEPAKGGPGGVRADAADSTSSEVDKDCQGWEPKLFNFRFSHFDRETVRRWTCMEAPSREVLLAQDASKYADWCFTCVDRLSRKDAPTDIGAGTISQLYAEILKLFETLSPEDYVIPAEQQVEIIQQYDIYVFPVSNFASAKQAIDLIVKQGEGNTTSVAFPSHYRHFFDIQRQYPVAPSSEPYWRLLENPTCSAITVEVTQRVFGLANRSYELLLLILTALYATRDQRPTQAPYFAPALGQEAFAPIMTMIVRSLAELLVQLRANDDGGRTGPAFKISEEVDGILRQPYSKVNATKDTVLHASLRPELGDINSLLARFERFNVELAKVQLTKGDLADAALFDWAQARLNYIKQNAERIQINISRIYQAGVFQMFKTEGY